MVRRVFLVREVLKWARDKRHRLPDSVFCDAVKECEEGLIDAAFGDVLKKRIPLGNRGKRGGGRTVIGVKELVGARRGDRWFFLYAYQKNEAPELTLEDIAAFQQLAPTYLSRSDSELESLCTDGSLHEVNCGGENVQI